MCNRLFMALFPSNIFCFHVVLGFHRLTEMFLKIYVRLQKKIMLVVSYQFMSMSNLLFKQSIFETNLVARHAAHCCLRIPKHNSWVWLPWDWPWNFTSKTSTSEEPRCKGVVRPGPKTMYKACWVLPGDIRKPDGVLQARDLCSHCSPWK